MEKTIAAISTAPGTGGIAVLRISGKQAIEIADRIFQGKQPLAQAATHTVHYGYIVNQDGIRVDEVLVTLMRAPRSFTCEDVVEISTHGGAMPSRRVLEEVIRAGAYPAEPGEFTKRAFLNGRIDLSQAEAVIDMIHSKNELAQKNALSQLEGRLSVQIEEIRTQLVSLAAQLQVTIDYPDEDLEDLTPAELLASVKQCRDVVKTLLNTADQGRILNEGIRTVIVGKPNVGKSSLLNLLARAERAIVTEIPGTTRDVIEETVNLDGVPLVLVDTAGIRDTEDIVEKIGVQRSKESMDMADLVVVVLDGSRLLEEDDKELLRQAGSKKRIILINKTDLGQSEYKEAVQAEANGAPVLEISAMTGDGLEQLSEVIRQMYHFGEIGQNDVPVITNIRHKASLLHAEESLGQMIQALEAGLPTDIASIDLNAAIDSLGEITGATVSEDVVSAIFHNFCVGK